MMLDVDKYKDLTLRVCYNKWPSGTKCTMSQKGNITTKDSGQLLFYRETLDRNPDLLDIFFSVKQTGIFTKKEINFILAIIGLLRLPDSAIITIENARVDFNGEFRTYLYAKKGGYVLVRYDLTKVPMFKREKVMNKYITVKEFKDATITV